MKDCVLPACTVVLVGVTVMFILSVILGGIAVNNAHERDAWRGRYETLHAQFQRHMRCMDASGCDARAIAPR